MIPLRRRNGSVADYALVDPHDAERLGDLRWYLRSNGYVARQETIGRKKQRTVLLHRSIMGLVPGDRLTVDHVNHDPLDNRRANLRVCTHAENCQNKARGWGKGSRHRGVSLSASGRWIAYCAPGGCMTYLGAFDTEEEAAEAARAWRAEHMPYSTN